MIYFRDDFWSHVCRCSAKGVNRSTFLAFQAESEINEFELPVPIDEYILGFDVSMDDIKIMQVKQGFRNDEDELFCFLFAQSMFRL